MNLNYIEYLPKVVSNIREFRVLGIIIDETWSKWDNLGQRLYNSIFPEDFDIETCKRWEKIFKITPLASDTLEDRRFRLKVRMNLFIPYTHRTIKNMLESLLGNDFELNVDYTNYSFSCVIALTKKKYLNEIISLLLRITPANLVMQVSLKYNTHYDLSHFTHEQLSRYTHQELREKVLEYLGE